MWETERNATQFLSSRMSRSMAANRFHLKCGVYVAVRGAPSPFSSNPYKTVYIFTILSRFPFLRMKHLFSFSWPIPVHVTLIPHSPSLFLGIVLYISGQQVFSVIDQIISILGFLKTWSLLQLFNPVVSVLTQL